MAANPVAPKFIPLPSTADVIQVGPIDGRNTDQCKTGTKRKAEEDLRSKKGKPIDQRLWWEQWDEAEAMRFFTEFDPCSPEHEKITAAAAGFTSGRVWPKNLLSGSGPRFIWEKFQFFLGVQKGASSKQAKAIKGVDGHKFGSRIITDPVTGLIDVKNVQVPASGKPTAEQKLKAFFNDPEKSIKIFMSSYSRSNGYIWAKANLDCIPRVLRYFINFLLRSKVLPRIEHQLHRSLEVIALAMVELPNTLNISKTFPDKFSLACNACWGQKADSYMFLTAAAEEPVDYNNTLEEPEAKRQKCDADIRQPASPVEPGKETRAETTGTWVTNGDGDWGAAAEGWGQEVIDEDSAWGSLGVDEPESLFSLLGPTALPLTHLPGIVERSMRRIVSITRPPSSVAKSPPLPEGVYEPSACAVELELDHRFAKVVLTPMIDWDGGDSPIYTKPSILASSRGAVVEDIALPIPFSGSPQPHNPASDEITVLIDDVGSQIDYLREGMAIGGTWVQLVRQGEPVVAKKKGKSKKSSYWYLAELALIIPSFWTIDDRNVSPIPF